MSRFHLSALLLLIIGSWISNIHCADNPDINLNRLRALGTAYMEEEDFTNAIRVYKEAAAKVPESVSDAINLGIAHYHGDINEESIRILTAAQSKEPKNPFANFTLGLAYKKIGDTTNALVYFENVAEVDQTDPATLYNLGLANFTLKNNDEAAKWFEKTIEFDPKHSASYYNLFLYYARVKKDMTYAKELMATFQKLKKAEPDRPADAVDEGKFLGPIEFDIPIQDRPNFTSELKARFTINQKWTDAVNKSTDYSAQPDYEKFSHEPFHARFLAAIPDIKNRNTAVILWKPIKTTLLVIEPDGKITKQAGLGTGFTQCAPADYDNDGDVDLLLYSPATAVRLLRNEGDWNLKAVTEQLGIPWNDPVGFVDALWCDFDADGDLDLFLSRPQIRPEDYHDIVLQNNGNGSFINITEKIEGLPKANSVSYAVSDLDNDNDLEIIRAIWNPAEPGKHTITVEVFSNLREVRFKKTAERTIPFQYTNDNYMPFKIICKDMNNDGRMDIALLGAVFNNNPEYALTMNDAGELTPLPNIGKMGIPPTLQGIADLNNDGYEDMLVSWVPPAGAVGYEFEGSIPQVMINQSPKNFLIDREAVTFDEPKTAFYFSPQTADIDFDGDLDLLLTSNTGIKILENQNGNQNHSITLQIEGSKNTFDGFGAKILLKDDLFFVKKEVDKNVTHIGIGDRDPIDVIRITWPNGIFQNLIHTAAGTIKSVTEKPGYAGSCLFVYTWNGEEYEFIADSLCNAPLGLYVGGGYYPPNPDEYIRIQGNQLTEKNGEYEILMREELREITYLDQMELLSASHPDAVEIHSNECFTMPPFPEFTLKGLSKNAHPPRRVIDNHGNDVTELIAKNDCQYPLPWHGTSRMDGVVKKHYFEIDLSDISDPKNAHLFMTGYLDWPNSSNARALEQNPEHDFVMPMLQVKDEKGKWQTVQNPMGFPAGKLKTVTLDLSDVFLSQDRTIRIVSTVQVHWDRILADPTPILDGFTVTHYPFKKAELRYGGYAKTYSLSEHGPQWYDYSTRYTNSRWDYQLGQFTRYGDVTPLLTGFDDKYIIIQHGDEVCVRFDAANAPQKKPANHTFFMKGVGWVKDLDYSTSYGQTVLPLPFKGMSGYPYGEDESYPWDEEHTAYYMKYNTRTFTRQNAPLTAPRTIAAPNITERPLRESE